MDSASSLAKRDTKISNYYINFTKKNRDALSQLAISYDITLPNRVEKLLKLYLYVIKTVRLLE